MKALKVISKTIGILVIAATIIICLMSFIPGLIGWEAANVVSGSMEPSIPVGSLVMAAPEDGENLQSGDVIMFLSGDSNVTHRIVSNDKEAASVITKGDANEKEDMNPVAYDRIKGKIVFQLPYVGQLLQILSTLTGKIYAIAAIVIGLILILLGSKKKKTD